MFFRRAFLLILPLLLLAIDRLHAQEAFVLGENVATVAFPNTVNFSLAYSGAEPVSALLSYDVDKFSCVEVSADVPITPDGDGTVEWQWVMSRSGNPPPGTDVTWRWTLTDAAGNTTTTEDQTVTLNDERFDWQTVTSDRITLHWYRGNVGEPLLESAVAGLNRLESEMGVELESDIEFWIYGNTQEMREAVIYINDWAGGVAFTNYNTILLGVSPTSLEWGRRVVAHELAHLVVGQFGRSCVGGSRPSWLEEGFAMVAEGAPESRTLAEIQNAIENNGFAPIRSLTGAFPAHSTGANLAYSQSMSIVDFMLDTYGAEKMQQLILLLAEGESYDDALDIVYGLNMDSLETQWREAIGAPDREIPPTLTPIVAAAVPTYPPIAAAQDFPTPETFSGTPFPATSTPQVSPTTEVQSEPRAEATATLPAATDTPVAVADVVPTETVAPVTQPTATTPPNYLLWSAVAVLILLVVLLLAFVFRPR